MATEVQLGSKMVHHTPRSTNLASHAAVSQKGTATRLLIVLEIFHTLMFFHRLSTDRRVVKVKRVTAAFMDVVHCRGTQA